MNNTGSSVFPSSCRTVAVDARDKYELCNMECFSRSPVHTFGLSTRLLVPCAITKAEDGTVHDPSAPA